MDETVDVTEEAALREDDCAGSELVPASTRAKQSEKTPGLFMEESHCLSPHNGAGRSFHGMRTNALVRVDFIDSGCIDGRASG
jgi:hypothetical protein